MNNQSDLSLGDRKFLALEQIYFVDQKFELLMNTSPKKNDFKYQKKMERLVKQAQRLNLIIFSLNDKIDRRLIQSN